MKSIYPIVALLILTGCAGKQIKDALILIENDLAFSRMSLEKGMNQAFIYYADDSVVILRDEKFPITGKNELIRTYTARSDSAMVLKWKPVRAGISRSNDLGYTFGDWELFLKDKDTTLYGNYLTVWKKQADGTWKYVLDSGVDTPKPPASL
jgi:ketosteroid isomerase-like protein